MNAPAAWTDQIHVGDCRALMRAMIAAGVRANCIVTSPPYWGLRDYGIAGQFGLERTWVRHVARMRSVFRLARSLLADDGTLWLNYGDSYCNSDKWGGGKNGNTGKQTVAEDGDVPSWTIRRKREAQRGLKPKDLVGMPWRVAFALQADGWYLRSDIIWHKPNPMPESITDRPTKAHEYLFLLSKSPRYFYDTAAAREPVNGGAHSRTSIKMPDGWDTGSGGHGTVHRAGREKGKTRKLAAAGSGTKNNDSMDAALTSLVSDRNWRTVWPIATEAFSESHFATFPRELVRRCILAGSRPGDIVFDPFMGSGTVAEVALSLGRRFIGCELNPEYAAMFKLHRSQQVGLGI